MRLGDVPFVFVDLNGALLQEGGIQGKMCAWRDDMVTDVGRWIAC